MCLKEKKIEYPGTIYSAQTPKLTGSCGKAQTYREGPNYNLAMNKSHKSLHNFAFKAKERRNMDIECCCQPQIAVKLESVLSSAVGLV